MAVVGWREVALLTNVGWVALVAGLGVGSPAEAPVEAAAPRVERAAAAPRVARPLPAVARATVSAVPSPRALVSEEDAPASAAASREEVRAEVLAELEDRVAARHEKHRERMLEHLLDRAERFAETFDLDEDELGELEWILYTTHDALGELPPPDPFADGPPPEDMRGRVREAFDEADARIADLLGPERAEAWRELSGPPGGPPGGAPPGPPPG